MPTHEEIVHGRQVVKKWDESTGSVWACSEIDLIHGVFALLQERGKKEDEIKHGHAFLDELSASGERGVGSIRERLFYYLRDIAIEAVDAPTSDELLSMLKKTGW